MAVSIYTSGVRFKPTISSVHYLYTSVREIPNFRDIVVLYGSLGYMLE